MKTLDLLVLATVLACDKAYAFTMRVTSCSETYGGTPDEEITFQFCEGGSYCTEDDTEDDVVGLPSGVSLGVGGTTVQINVSPGYEPTTVKIIKGDNHDSWCIADVTWENGDNLLGQDAKVYLESQTDTDGCIDGIADSLTEVSACASTWHFFNINGASAYEYDVRFKACAGTSSSSVWAYFCSNSQCDGTIGEEESVLLEMNDVEGGWTETSFPLPFNPLAMRLEEADGDVVWCADDLTFNAFPVILNGNKDMTDFETAGSQIFPNIQADGQGDPPIDETASADEDSDEGKWLDAAWEVAITVIGAAVVAAGAGCIAFACRRAQSLSGPSRRPDAHPGKAEGSTADADGAKEQEERPYFS